MCLSDVNAQAQSRVGQESALEHTGTLSGLTHRGDHPKLLQHPQAVIVDPAFHQLAIDKPVAGHPCHRELLARWCDAEQFALVRATRRLAKRDRVALANDVLNREMEIGKGAAKRL